MSGSGKKTSGSRRLQIKTPDLDEIISEIGAAPPTSPPRPRFYRKLLKYFPFQRLTRLYGQRFRALFHKSYPFDVPPPGRSAAGLGRRDAQKEEPPYPGCAYTGFTFLAEGGEGLIETASDPHLQRVIAVKSLKEKFRDDPAVQERFRREAVLTARLSHPGIVPMYALYQDPDGGIHSVMKLIDGETLSSYLNYLTQTYRQLGVRHFDEGRALRERLGYFLRICSAVSFAHEEEGVIHRDIKPENVMLGRFDQVYVMDWGVACRLDESDPAGHVKRIMGTPSYLAPEALAEKVQNVRTDVYALGLLLFEIVYLKRAFPGSDTRTVITHVLGNRRQSPYHAFNVRIDRELKAIIAKASAFDPGDRYGSVRELADDLKKYLAGRETQAAPDNLFHAVTRWHRLNRHAAAAIYLSVLLAALLLGGLILHWNTVAKARQESRERLLSTVYAACVEEAHRTDLFFYQQQRALSDCAHDVALLQTLPLPESGAASRETLQKKRLTELLRRSGEKLSRPHALWVTLVFDRGQLLRVPELPTAVRLPDVRREAWYVQARQEPARVVVTHHRDKWTGNVPTTRLSCSLPGGRGVVSLVLSPAFLVHGMVPYQKRQETGTVKEFVSRSGLVTTEITGDRIALLPLRPESLQAKRFDDPKLLQEIIRRDYGATLHNGPQGPEVVAFAYLPTLDSWYLIRQRYSPR